MGGGARSADGRRCASSRGNSSAGVAGYAGIAIRVIGTTCGGTIRAVHTGADIAGIAGGGGSASRACVVRAVTIATYSGIASAGIRASCACSI